MTSEVKVTVKALRDENRHTTAMYLVARAYGLIDLRREFASLHAASRRTKEWTESMNTRRYLAYLDMRRRIVDRLGIDEWLQVPL